MFETSSSPWATASKQTVTHYESIMSYHSSSTTQKKSLWISPETKWPAKTSVSPRSSPLGAFPQCETFPAAKSEEKRMFSQARNKGCLPFTWVNRSVHGLGKWYAKFETGKFRKRVYHCTYQFHLPENDREGLMLVSKMALKKWNANLCLQYFVRKNRTTFSDVPLLPEVFPLERSKPGRVSYTYQPDFPESFCKW